MCADGARLTVLPMGRIACIRLVERPHLPAMAIVNMRADALMSAAETMLELRQLDGVLRSLV